jgi:uncharacterized protein
VREVGLSPGFLFHPLRLRRLIIVLHRDVGYFFAGLTVVYAASGIAVNHVAHWNPSYDIRRAQSDTGPLPEGDEAAALAVMERLAVSEKPNAVVRVAPSQLKVFLEGRTLTIDTEKRRVEDETVRKRAAFFQANFLHLNHGKGLWTWFADLYALGLILLAGTGLVMLRGRLGLAGRGKWLVAAGLVVPLLFLLWR